jgi:hypothetical protein
MQAVMQQVVLSSNNLIYKISQLEQSAGEKLENVYTKR